MNNTQVIDPLSNSLDNKESLRITGTFDNNRIDKNKEELKQCDEDLICGFDYNDIDCDSTNHIIDIKKEKNDTECNHIRRFIKRKNNDDFHENANRFTNNEVFYYSEIKQFNGIVKKVKGNKFDCIITEIDKDNASLISFDRDDVSCDSDWKLVSPGAQFVLIVGIEKRIVVTPRGPKSNDKKKVCNIIFRRISGLSKKELEDANKTRDNWTKLFNE